MFNIETNHAFHLLNASYMPSQTDVAVFEALTAAPASEYLHCLRWYNHIKSYGDAKKEYVYRYFCRLFLQHFDVHFSLKDFLVRSPRLELKLKAKKKRRRRMMMTLICLDQTMRMMLKPKG